MHIRSNVLRAVAQEARGGICKQEVGPGREGTGAQLEMGHEKKWQEVTRACLGSQGPQGSSLPASYSVQGDLQAFCSTPDHLCPVPGVDLVDTVLPLQSWSSGVESTLSLELTLLLWVWL